MYNYIFPNSDTENKLFKNKIIDFKDSFIINTNITKQDIKSKHSESLESTIKKEFKKYKFENKKYGKSNEILKNDSYLKIKEFFLRNNQYNILSLADYTGFKNSIEMKEFNIKQGIKDNVLSFYGKKNKPIVYLKNYH